MTHVRDGGSHWSGGTTNPDGSITGGAGIVNLPRCAATYQAIGRMIVAAGEEGTSADVVHNPPAWSLGQPEPKCLTPIRAPPSTWSWCSRDKGGDSTGHFRVFNFSTDQTPLKKESSILANIGAFCAWNQSMAGNGGFACDTKTKQCVRDLAGVYETRGECETKCA